MMHAGCRNVSFLLDRLWPLFPVDQLLQRSLMAAMTVNQIEAMITSKKIAPEVCMANITFFLNNNEIPDYQLKQVQSILGLKKVKVFSMFTWNYLRWNM